MGAPWKVFRRNGRWYAFNRDTGYVIVRDSWREVMGRLSLLELLP
jgi:hypothetical protein